MTGLSRERLAAIGAALDAIDARAEELAACRVWQWALAMSWELSPRNVLWCLGDTERIHLAGGGAWRDVLGRDVADLAGRPWREFIADAAEVAAARAVIADNLGSGHGVEGLVNHYRHATAGTLHRVVWRVSPWRDGRAVARGEVET